MKTPLMISLEAAFLATLICVVLGTFLARFILYKRRWQSIVEVITTIPMILPPTVTGFLLLKCLGKRGLLGSWLGSIGISVVFSFTGVLIASTVVAFPLMYRTILGSFLQVDEDVLQAARTLGISETKIFFQILLPNAKEGVIAGIVLTFTRALGEFGATIMLAGNIPGKTQTMSIAIYQAVLQGNDQVAYQYVGIMILISIVSLSLMNLMIRRKKR